MTYAACVGCKWWLVSPDPHLRGDVGECRRRAPLGITEPAITRYDANNVKTIEAWHVVRAWPLTQAADGCGDFEART